MFARNPFYALSFLIFSLKLNVAEWVDMPQFSDENKIYRIPSMQYDQFYKFKRGDINNNDLNNKRNGSHHLLKIIHAMDDKITEIKETISSSESTTASYLLSDEIADALIKTNFTPLSIDVMTEDKLFDKHDTSLPKKEEIFNTVTQSLPSSTVHRQEISQDKCYNHTFKSEDGILQYFPVEILKNVHRILQSQPTSLQGKIRFLKTFEKTLMSEIESRLATAMIPSRKTRGADHYGHDDHDDHHVGFPSIEGALMAISFLTFAVYLVRLIMLLFQNMNNPMATTTAATLFLGKRKRSIDLDDETARILNNMNNFVSPYYPYH